MRATRGLMASMGAATCLILAGTIALTLLSGVIAFQGWPGAGVDGGGEQEALIAQVRDETVAEVTTVARMSVPASRRTLASAPPRPARQAARRAVARRATAGAPRVTASAGTALRTPAATTTGATPSGTTTPATASTGTPAATPGGEGVRRLGQNLGGAVDTTGTKVQEVVTPVAPTVGTALQETTQQVGGVVQGVTGAVGQVVDSLAVTAP